MISIIMKVTFMKIEIRALLEKEEEILIRTLLLLSRAIPLHLVNWRLDWFNSLSLWLMS